MSRIGYHDPISDRIHVVRDGQFLSIPYGEYRHGDRIITAHETTVNLPNGDEYVFACTCPDYRHNVKYRNRLITVIEQIEEEVERTDAG